jgi:beta-1,4-endoglucanase-1
MAKKQKVELTPEEKAAKKLRHSNGWVRFWAIVVALALTAGIYGLASKTASKETAATGTATASGSSTGSSSSSSGSSSGSSSSSSSGASASSSSSGASASAGDSSGAAAAASSGVDAAAAAEAINAATAKAVAAGYHWTRSAQYTQPIDVGSATSGLNTLIKGIDSEASLDSVVGGFIGIGDKEMDITKGGSAAEQIEYHGENYALQATSLKAEDLKNLKVDGNTYTFEVENATSPQTDKSTAMSRLTNDILTQSMVDSEIKNFISAAKINSATIEYTNIKATVVIEDGNLKEFKYSYDGNVAELNIKVSFISVSGKGAMHVDGAYTNFVY